MSEMADRKNKSRRNKQSRCCPICSSTRLENVGGEYFCRECDWDSVDIYARICANENSYEHLRDPDEEVF